MALPEKTTVSLSSLTRYNNKLKELIITDANVTEDNKLKFTYLNAGTKDVELPSAPNAVADVSVTDNTMKVTMTDETTKDVELPSAPKAVSGIAVTNNNLNVTFTDETTADVALPETTVPTAVADAGVVNGYLTLTYTDSNTKDIELPSAPVSVADATVSDGYLQLTYTDSNTKELELPNSVADANIVDTDRLELTFLDASTKQLQLPSAPKAVSGVAVTDNNLNVTFTDATTSDVALPNSVADANIVDTDKLELTFLDASTKQLQLPTAGGTTRTVTRIPVYFEVHFKLRNSNTDLSKLEIPLSVAKDIIKIESSCNNVVSPVVTNITDVTKTAAENDSDTVFLVSANITPEFRSRAHHGIKFKLVNSFEMLNLQNTEIMDAITSLAGSETTVTQFNAQVIGGDSITTSWERTSMVSNLLNKYKIYAVADISGFAAPSDSVNDFGYLTESTYGNSYISYSTDTTEGTISFDLSLEDMTSDLTRDTFSVTE